MFYFLNEYHKELHKEFSDYVSAYVEPFAGLWDMQQGIPKDFINEVLGRTGYLGCIIPKEYGGMGSDLVTFGLLNEAFGFGSSSLTVLFTVQNMVASTLIKWGTEKQRSTWLEPMAHGEVIAAFALTEPNAGSDIHAIETVFTQKGNTLYLNGSKKWITFAGLADLFLIFGKLDGKPLACLIPRNSAGLRVTPIKNMLGFKACHMAQLDMENVPVSLENMIGKPGFAFAYVAPFGLHYGRMSTAFSATGLMRACLKTACDYASSRVASNTTLNHHGTIKELITEMGLNYESAMALCLNAALAEDNHSELAMEKVIMAKYYSSQAAVRVASDTVQILGAMGCNEESSNASRYYRDAKIMEIIEGTKQVLQHVLCPSFIKQYMGNRSTRIQKKENIY